jgi:nucleotide-binding universal stress UspA family protein
MKRVLVATDLSVRSDRAIRRAILLARRHGAALSLLHVIDDDQPSRLVRAERDAATALVEEQARSIREGDGIDCSARVVMGDPFEGIAAAAGEQEPDLVVIGPHRRQALKDVFTGTTAERTIRASRRPVLMANAVPASAHRHVLLAVDFSDCSADAVRTVAELGFEAHAAVSVLHVFDAPATPVMARSAASEEALSSYHAQERDKAAAALKEFLAPLPLAVQSRIAERNVASAAETIRAVAADVGADLLVVGTRGRSGIAKMLLGSVAEQVLRTAETDVLAVPPRQDPVRPGFADRR